ncbi:nuclear transport factor 2 family protein [Nocardioides massiliensis]|uniref:Uncharacterized protein (TIGR02246 family) n=1 Tax=Nocardioides massiliensis TaxID=1325935 RepID=A0ABT9NKF5_9ACTN|nr:nuclear transport factor 2 family protein [Nocardioides massiliensis]MDP9820878.1 uncharacterized protein (TIGR02246 family) [Nocardioides massiliensis]
MTSPPDPPPGPTDAAEERAIRAAHAAFYAAFETGDLDAMNELWVEDDSALCVHPGTTPVQGVSAVRRAWAVIMATTPYIQFILTDIDVRVRGEVAYVTCVENVLAGDHDDPDLRSGLAIATHVMLRTVEGWRLWVRHASPVVSETDHEN